MNPLWSPAPMKSNLQDGDVHIWSVALVQPPAIEATLSATLSADERERADRFHFERDRKRYIIGRGILRLLLELYTGEAAKAISFSYNPQGKPALEDNHALQFNVSNSRDLGLYALTLNKRIGVDIEYRRSLTDMLGVAKSSFSANEFQQFIALSPQVQPEAFFNCWTRKEAYIKAIGEGLSHPLGSFDVAFVPGAAPRFLRITGDDVNQWSIQSLSPHEDYTAAVVVEGIIDKLMCWQWQPSS